METSLKERLRYALDKAGISQSELARQAKVSSATIAYILSGRNRTTSSQNLARFSDVLGVSADWLAGVSIALPSNAPSTTVQVPFYKINLAKEEFSLLQTGEFRSYDKKFFEDKGLSIEDCKLFHIDMDSMEPLLFPGDGVLVDCSDVTPWVHSRAHIYVFTNEKRILVHKLSCALEQISIQSLNQSYPSVSMDLDSFRQKYTIIGRVRDRFGDSGL